MDMPWPPLGDRVLKAGTESKWHCVLPRQLPGQVWSHPKNNSSKSKLNYMAVASHNQAAISLPVHYAKSSHIFRGSFISGAFTIFLWAQTHHPIPAPTQKECGVSNQRDGALLKRTLGGRQRQTKERMGVPGTITQDKAHVLPQRQCSICPSKARHVQPLSSAPRLLYCSYISDIPPTLSFVSSSHSAYKLQMGHLFPNLKMSKKKTLLSDRIKWTFWRISWNDRFLSGTFSDQHLIPSYSQTPA